MLLASAAAFADSPPPYDGAMSFREIKGPLDPEDFSWQVFLDEGQALEQLDDQTALVYFTAGHFPAGRITAQPAHDAVGANVPTTLSVSDGDIITLTVHHREGNPLAGGAPFVYPVMEGSGWEGGFVTTTITGPKTDRELREEREQREREAQEALEATIRQEEAEACIVPKLKGKSLRSARIQLRLAHCRLGMLAPKSAKHLGRARSSTSIPGQARCARPLSPST
jgi:hypothetical protein